MYSAIENGLQCRGCSSPQRRPEPRGTRRAPWALSQKIMHKEPGIAVYHNKAVVEFPCPRLHSSVDVPLRTCQQRPVCVRHQSANAYISKEGWGCIGRKAGTFGNKGLSSSQNGLRMAHRTTAAVAAVCGPTEMRKWGVQVHTGQVSWKLQVLGGSESDIAGLHCTLTIHSENFISVDHTRPRQAKNKSPCVATRVLR